MASAFLVRKIRKNPWVQLAAVEILAVNVKHEEDMSDEYKQEAGSVLKTFEKRMRLEWVTPKKRAMDAAHNEIAELAQKMERALVNAGLLSRDN